MKKTVFVLFVLCFIFQFQIQAQSNEVEVYIVHSDSILKGAVINSTQDSLTIQMDSATFISFAKTELQGRDLAVSKEIKKFQKKILRAKLKEDWLTEYPGKYLIKNGQRTKGYIILGLEAISLITVCVAGCGLIYSLIRFSTGAVIANSIILSSSVAVNSGASLWYLHYKYKKEKQKVDNRYYYTGTRY